jgi:hypothetical protein
MKFEDRIKNFGAGIWWWSRVVVGMCMMPPGTDHRKWITDLTIERTDREYIRDKINV